MKKSTESFELSQLQLQKEIKRAESGHHRRTRVQSVIMFLTTLCAFGALLTVLWFPVFRVSGESNVLQLEKGDVVIAHRTNGFVQGNIVSVSRDNHQILLVDTDTGRTVGKILFCIWPLDRFGYLG